MGKISTPLYFDKLVMNGKRIDIKIIIFECHFRLSETSYKNIV